MTFLSSFWSTPDDSASVSASSIGGSSSEAGCESKESAQCLVASSSCEEEALATALSALDCQLSAHNLPESDPWRELLPQPNFRKEIVLRILRYQTHNTGRAIAQMRAILQWRMSSKVGEIPAEIMRGPSAGLPVTFIPILGRGRMALLYAAARLYRKRYVLSACTERSFLRLFEHILYARDGLRAAGAVVVIDFCDVSIREVDLPTIRQGITVFLQHYPESFPKILCVNFPRFIFHFWNLLKPLLDARTVERVEWCETPLEVPRELGKWFERDEIPVWLGGGNDRIRPDILIGDGGIDEKEMTIMWSVCFLVMLVLTVRH